VSDTWLTPERIAEVEHLDQLMLPGLETAFAVGNMAESSEGVIASQAPTRMGNGAGKNRLSRLWMPRDLH